MTSLKSAAANARAAPRAVPDGLAALLASAALFLAMLATHRIVAIDDAFISYRYAENLVRSGELVFNLGERVEGATNLLWILLLAGVRRLTGAPPELAAIVAAMGLLIFAMARCAMVLRLLGLELWRVALVLVAVFACGDVFLALTNGLEAALYAALLTEALASVHRRRLALAGLMVGLLFMTRPEGALVGLVLLLPLIPELHGRRDAARLMVPALVPIVGTTLFRAAYFHALVPNSVVAKSFPLRLLPEVLVRHSWPYLRSFAASDAGLALVGAAAAAAVGLSATGHRGEPDRGGGGGGMESRLTAALVLAIALSVAIVARNGGDWMPDFRLLTQYAPLYCILLGLLQRRLGRLALPVLLLVAAVPLLSLAGSIRSRGCCRLDVRTEPPAGIFAAAAERLAPIVTASDLVSAEAAGLLPYRLLSTRIHDPLGLMDPTIARHGTPAIPYGKIDVAYTFEQVRPSFMVWHWAGHVFGASEAARANYAAFCFDRCDSRTEAGILLVRKDRLDAEVERAFADWSPWPYLGS